MNGSYDNGIMTYQVEIIGETADSYIIKRTDGGSIYGGIYINIVSKDKVKIEEK
jgi:hypothetical protein